jgi:hypothetical protein
MIVTIELIDPNAANMLGCNNEQCIPATSQHSGS